MCELVLCVSLILAVLWCIARTCVRACVCVLVCINVYVYMHMISPERRERILDKIAAHQAL